MVLEISEEQCLLRSWQRPERDVVAELGHPEESGEPDERAVPVQVIACLDRAFPAQVIGEFLVARELVHVAEQAVEADVEARSLRPYQIEPLGRAELAANTARVERVLDAGGIVRTLSWVFLGR
jgi:hypothetical protein